MSLEHKQPEARRQVTLFVSSACHLFVQAASYCQGWGKNLPEVALEVVSIQEERAQFVRLGLTYTLALVIDGQVVAQKVSIDRLAELLSTHHS